MCPHRPRHLSGETNRFDDLRFASDHGSKQISRDCGDQLIACDYFNGEGHMVSFSYYASIARNMIDAVPLPLVCRTQTVLWLTGMRKNSPGLMAAKAFASSLA